MGLDVNLKHIPIAQESLPLLRKHLQTWRERRSAVCNGKPAYQATLEEKKRYQDLVIDLYEKAKSYGWYPMEEIHKSSSKNPHNDIGYWRIGYGVGSKPEGNLALRVLYDAFPEAHPNFGITVGADWAHAQRVVEDVLVELRKVAEQHTRDIVILESVLETISFVLSQADPETYFLDWGP